MKKSVKAALWSGLVFPGAGHFFLKHSLRGFIVFIPAVISIGIYIQGLITQVQYVMDKITNGSVSLDPNAVEAMLNAVPGSQTTDIAFWVFVVFWVAGLIDAYWLGSMQDKENDANKKHA